MMMHTVIGGLYMTNHQISFKQITTGKVIEMTLYSHYTCIYGKDSGEGKTEFFSLIEDGINTEEIEVISDLPFTIATAATLNAILEIPNRTIIMIDESVALQKQLMTQMNNSKHVFVCISRATPFKLEYSLNGIYYLMRDGGGWFDVKQDNVLQFASDDFRFDKIVTESVESRSEHELLSNYFDNIVCAGGKNKIEKKLRNSSENILVFADLSNIGSALSILQKRCIQNPNIRFYPYQSFEQLLLKSTLVQELNNKVDLCNFDFFSNERYYEEKLEKVTKNTELEYKHGKPLAKKFLKKENAEKVFNSDVGHVLWDYICNFSQIFHMDLF